MDILVEITSKNGTARKFEIRKAPQGTEQTVLEQFLASAGDTSFMLEEVTGEPAEADDDTDDHFRIELAGAAYTGDSLAELAATIEQDLANARRSRMNASPLHIDTRDEKAAYSRRVEVAKRNRKKALVHQAVADCLAKLAEPETANKAF